MRCHLQLLIWCSCAIAPLTNASNFEDVRRAAAQLDQEVAHWKRGDEVPHRLLSFPEGDVDPLSIIQSDAFDAFKVGPYIYSLKNDALLQEIFFDPRSEKGALQAAAVTLIDHKGLPWFSQMLAKRNSTRWEHDAVREILRRPFVETSVAFISKNQMAQADAKRVLEELKGKLEKGESWKDAYGSIADANPDVERRKLEPNVPTTRVTYLFSGWASEFGFDFSQLRMNSNVPASYFADAIRSGKGGRIVSAVDGEYLVYVFDVYKP
jgi:hypothetical protein